MRRFIATLALLLATSPLLAVEINQASEAELDGIKGIGPSLSGRILQAREKEGAFSDWADLMRRVKGIRPQSARHLSAAGLTVNSAAYTSPQARTQQPVSAQ